MSINEDVIQDERNKGNQVAMAIKALALEKGKITLTLPLMSDGYDSEGSNHSKTSEWTETLDVVVDIYQSAYSNARSLYSEKKIAAIKEVKSLNASSKALVLAERKIMERLAKKTSDIPTISKTRVTGWYEQFHWFISTENCLVIGGRDPTQCDQLLMKYFKESDILLSCDMEGSTLCIVKKSDGPIGNATLLQASTMVVCSSKAWDNKIVTSAYFLSFEQVTKVANGEVLPPGKFEIKGVKNWLPPVQIQYGVGLLWCIDDDSRKRHFDDRRPWKRGAVEAFEVEKSGNIENGEKLNEADSLNGEILSAIISTPIAPEVPRFIEGVDHTENTIEITELNSDLPGKISGSTNDSSRNGRKLSAKQRKLLKKGKSIVEQSSLELYNDPNLHQSKSSSPAVASKLPRGKKSKLKKIKEKYGYEDEGFQNRSASTINEPNGDQTKQKLEISSPKTNDLVPNPKKDPFKVLEDSKLFAVPEYELNNLVGLPFQEDILQACIPLCAPWLALQKFKYKIKIIPGSLKRGKACAQAKDAFLKMSLKFKAEAEHELIGQIPPKDWNDAMMSKAKLVISDKK